MRNVSSKINLIGDIIGNLKQIKAGVSKVTEEARKATGQTTKLQSVCDKLNMANLSATLDVFDRLSSHIESATEVSMSFGQAMADLSSITGITGAELEELRVQVEDLKIPALSDL
jgi:hypothetical protein